MSGMNRISQRTVRIKLAGIASLVALLTLTGCSLTIESNVPNPTEPGLLPDPASAPPTVPSEEVAEVTVATLEAETGTTPVVDCGTGNVALEEGTVLMCSLTDPDTKEDFDTIVTLINVDEPDFEVNAVVSDVPKEEEE